MIDIPKVTGTVVLVLAASVMWFAFIRRGPEQTALATILTKGHLSGSTYVQQPIGANRGFNTPTSIQIAEANAFDLKVDGLADPVRASFNTVKSRQFEVGQRVRIQYVRRGIPPLWSRLTVVEMMPDSTK
jgi:hypothetical protein